MRCWGVMTGAARNFCRRVTAPSNFPALYSVRAWFICCAGEGAGAACETAEGWEAVARPERSGLAARLRRETTLPVRQIAQRLQMGSWRSLNNQALPAEESRREGCPALIGAGIWARRQARLSFRAGRISA